MPAKFEYRIAAVRGIRLPSRYLRTTGIREAARGVDVLPRAAKP
jgi:hypothetical protein